MTTTKTRRRSSALSRFLNRVTPGWWRYLPNPDRYAVLNACMAILWALVFGLFTPAALADVINRTTTLVFVAYIIIGGVLVIVGRVRHSHTMYELSGLSLLIAGMLFYFTVQFTLGVLGGNPDRYALAVLAFWLVTTLFERYDELLRHFIPLVREWARDLRKERRDRARVRSVGRRTHR